MGFNLGGLAGGLSQGINQGMSLSERYEAKQDRERERAVAEEERTRVNEANAAGAAELKKRQEQWAAQQAASTDGTYGSDHGLAAAGGEQMKAAPAWKPGRDDYLAAHEARSAAFAKAGDWRNFMQNEVATAPLRISARNEAIDSATARFALDGDVEGLAKSVYPKVFDGREIKDVVKIPAQAGGDQGETAPERFQFKLSDGTTSKPMSQDDILNQVRMLRQDPEAVAKYEMQSNLQRSIREYEAKKQIEVEQVKSKNRREEDAADNEAKKAITEAQIRSREKTAGMSAGATLGAAKIGAASREKVAGLRDGATSGGSRKEIDQQIKGVDSDRKSLKDEREQALKAYKAATEDSFDPDVKKKAKSILDATLSDLDKQSKDLDKRRRRLNENLQLADPDEEDDDGLAGFSVRPKAQ
jgi:hypothetical protein